jgi:molybdenum cofactor biosynthesis protein B
MPSDYQSPSAEQHREAAPSSVACAVVTVSDTRTLDNDGSGAKIVELLAGAGHRVADRRIVKDEPAQVEAAVRELAADPQVDAILLTGGTGIAARDQTPDAIRGLLTRELPGYGEIFRVLSFQEIGAAAMLSRALGGVIDQTIVLLMPGSTAAVRLAMEKLILPEIAHLVEHARR